MEGIDCKIIHNVIINCLNREDDNKLKVVGSWYFRFLNSDVESLTLHLPSYSKELAKLSFYYIRLFTIIYSLLKENELTEFENTCLFEIFNKSSKSQITDLILDFQRRKDNLALWGGRDNSILTKMDEFLPVFDKEELIEFGKLHTIRNSFKLYKCIRDSEIIAFPLLVNLQENVLSFNNIDGVDDEFISEVLISVEKNLDDEIAEEIEDNLIENGINNRIVVKFPYSKKPHPYLMDVGKKRFKLELSSRFAYNEISEEDIYLLKEDGILKNQLEFKIVDTKHSKDLFYLFKDFKNQWNKMELNKYTTPFPKYWFLFLNNSLSKDDWLIQFKKDFPAVADNPIIKKIEKIINEVVELNWIENEISGGTKILFPELKSLRKKRLVFVFNNFKNYINTINSDVSFITNITDNNLKNVILLDSFNIIDLVNKNQITTDFKIKIIVPDFLYFGYQPWIKYHIFNYQSTPLLSSVREKIDDNFLNNKETVEHLREGVIKEIKQELKIYKSKYKNEIEKDVSSVEPDENPNEEDLEFSNVEEIENTHGDKESNHKFLIINQDLENELKLSSSEKVLIQKDTLLYVKAGLIKVGDFILRNRDISKLYKSDSLYDNLVNIPSSVLDFQSELSSFNNVYQILKFKGISYQHQNYFDKNYVINNPSDDKFRIPRRKKDWAIICEFLNIDHSDQQLAFIAYYGRSKQNELKKMYKLIISLLLDNNWIGTIDNPDIVISVSNVVNKFNNIFSTSDSNEIVEISESIISTIINQLSFTEIETIKIIGDE